MRLSAAARAEREEDDEDHGENGDDGKGSSYLASRHEGRKGCGAGRETADNGKYGPLINFAIGKEQGGLVRGTPPKLKPCGFPRLRFPPFRAQPRRKAFVCLGPVALAPVR